MSLSRLPAVVEWGNHNSFAKLSTIYYSDAKEILESLLLRKIWPELVLGSCRWRQIDRYTWKRTRLWTNFAPSGMPHWVVEGTTYSTTGGQLQPTISWPVYATWQRPWTAGTLYLTTCPSSSLPKKAEMSAKQSTRL